MPRSALLLTTGLIAASLATAAPRPARAQTALSPNALPTGMRVVAGQATGTTQGQVLTVQQTTPRAATEWAAFNIGSQAALRIQQPSAQSVSLNQVVGAGASTIAGHLSSNGQVVLINQSGVVFTPTAVVDAQSVVVSATGITQANMVAGVASGHFVLDQAPHAGAAIVNAGHIGTRKAGLAALVAPSIANHGTITAPIGTVQLAGSTAQVVDLYGDGLLSLDVSSQTIPGASGGAALVTNGGVLAAPGGTVTLTTAAIDGVVGNLVAAGGTISADAPTHHGGTVLIDADGGIASVTGTLSARGPAAPDGHGGTVTVRAGNEVDLAATAVIDASGSSHGGVVAIGTTPTQGARRTTQRVAIAAGAVVRADALLAGDGGQITVRSLASTVVAGHLSARGGPQGGNGGSADVSSGGTLSLTGVVDLSAPAGANGVLTVGSGYGNITIDGTGANLPASGTLSVGPAGANATILASSLQGIASLALTADQNIVVTAAGAISLPLVAGAAPSLSLTALHGAITVQGAITTSGALTLSSGLGITLAAPVSAAGSITLKAGAAIAIDAALAAGTGQTLSLRAPAITLGAAGTLAAPGGVVELAPPAAGPVTLGGGLAGFVLTQADLTQVTAATLRLGAAAGITTATGITVAGPFQAPASVATLELDAGTGGIAIAQGLLGAATLRLGTSGAATQSAAAVVAAGTLATVGRLGAALVLANPANRLGTLDAIAATGLVALASATPLTLSGTIDAGTGPAALLSLRADGIGYAGGALRAPQGLVEIGTVGPTLELGASLPLAPAIDPAVLAYTEARLLRLGAAYAGPGLNPVTTVTIAIDAAVAPGAAAPGGVGTLDLQAAVGVAENPAAGALLLPGGTLTGTVGSAATPGSVSLGGANQIGALGRTSVFDGGRDGAGAFALTDAVPLAVVGTVAVGTRLAASGVIDPTAAGTLALTDLASPAAGPAAITIAATARLRAGTVVLTLDPAATLSEQSGASITTTALHGGADALDGSAGSLLLRSPTNSIGTIGALAVTGLLDLWNDRSLAEGAGSTLSAGTLSARLSPTPGTSADLLLQAGRNAVATLGGISVPGGFALADTIPLAIAGTVSAASAITLASAGSLTLAPTGALLVPGGALTLTADGAIEQPGAAIVAASLGAGPGSAGTYVLAGDNTIAALGDVALPATGVLTLVDRRTLALTGLLAAGLADLSTTQGGLVETGAGRLAVATLRSGLGIAGDTVLASAANQVAAVGPFASAGAFLLRDATGLALGPLAAAGVVDLSTSAGGIDATGPVATPLLTSSFGIAGDADFGAAGNLIPTLGPIRVGGGLTLADATGLTVAGPLAARDATLASTAALLLRADIVVPGTLSLDSAGATVRAGGGFAVGTLAGSATGLASFGTGAQVRVLGAYSVSGHGIFALADATSLILAGPLSADYIQLAATGTLLWAGDITTLGLPRASLGRAGLSGPGSWLQVLAPPGGTGAIVQVGTAHVRAAAGDPLATLRLQLPKAGGAISFADLDAPDTDLILAIGPGHVTGQVDVAGLLALVATGGSGGSELVGSVQGLTGPGAARVATISPLPNPDYRIDGCALGSVNCVVLPTITLPPQRPLPNLFIAVASTDEDTDTDLLLPNVAEEDY